MASDLRSLLSACTHCGDCLEACPTYVISGLETESPRGRLRLLEFAQNNPGRDTATVAAHIASCTGCLGCVSACPEDVAYDEILPLARASARQTEMTASERAQAAARKLTLDTITHPWTLRRLAPVLRAARRFPIRRTPQQLMTVAELFPQIPSRPVDLPHFTPASGEPRGHVGLLLGCSDRIMHAGLLAATIAVLAAEGFEVIAPERPDCCGAIHLAAGYRTAARERAGRTVEAFQAIGGVDRILTVTGGCGAAMKRYGELLDTPESQAFASLVSDVCEFLAAHAPRTTRHPLPLTVAWHASCQGEHAQRLHDAPARRLLEQIPELTVIESVEPGLCCGGMRSYRIDQPELARRLGARRARQLLATAPDVIASSSPDCAEQITRHLDGGAVPVRHPLELLAQSLQLPGPVEGGSSRRG